MIKVTVSKNLGPLEDLSKALRERLQRSVARTAFKIEGDAKIDCPVLTGALRASIYTVTADESGRSLAIAEAERLYWAGKDRNQQSDVERLEASYIAPESALKNTNGLSALVSVGMSYGIYVEYGTNRTIAQPFMAPAAEKGKAYFEEQVKNSINEAAKESGWKEN